MSNPKLPWILAGYRLFAQEGLSGLKVEVLSRQVQINKSSFYHHFGDLEGFIDHLLAYHMERAAFLAEVEGRCKNVNPELFTVIVDNKEDLLFNRQLRVHRQYPRFESYALKANEQVGNAIAGIWAQGLGLPENSYLAAMVLNLSLENFYLQITEETLTFDWLVQYFSRLQMMIKELKRHQELSRANLK